MSMLRTTAFAVCAVLLASPTYAQAKLVIENQSQRQMTVKVMRAAGAEDAIHATTSVSSYGTQTVFFSESGTYFLKTMAVLFNRDPIFQRGSPFQVYNGRDGFSVLTVTFTIQETAVPQVLGGKQITKEEFDRDRSNR